MPAQPLAYRDPLTGYRPPTGGSDTSRRGISAAEQCAIATLRVVQATLRRQAAELRTLPPTGLDATWIEEATDHAAELDDRAKWLDDTIEDIRRGRIDEDADADLAWRDTCTEADRRRQLAAEEAVR